jgi:thioredoxin 1
VSNVAQVSEQAFDAEVLKSKTPVLVDFFTTWCGPCKALAPVVDEIAKDLTGKLKVVKVDLDEANDLAATLGITSVPTLVLFQDGKEATRRTGSGPKRDILAFVQTVVK